MTSNIITNDQFQEKPVFDRVNSTEDDDDEQQNISLSSANSFDEQEINLMNNIETSEDKKLNRLYDYWIELDGQLREFETKHNAYVRKLDEVESLKTQYRYEFNKYKKKLAYVQKNVVQLQKTYLKKDEKAKKNSISSSSIPLKNSHLPSNLVLHRSCSFAPGSLPHPRPLTSVNSFPALDKIVDKLSSAERLTIISDQLDIYKSYLSRISDTLPRKDSYLKVILGRVDVSILNKIDKWKYKQEYEKFKFIVTCISLVLSFIIWPLASSHRTLDALFQFLLVWYYCTLTIRESILIVNGSNINFWWRTHHFISTVATAILLTWPQSHSYQTFRTQFFVFSFYLSFVQVLQSYYQRGCLYRLRALGETHDMDITVEGFQRWMFRGLSFLVPFLVVAYIFQLYIAYTLWQLSHDPKTREWQVFALSIIFLILFLGNLSTTYNVLRDKLREKTRPILLKEKYQSFKTFLATSYHRRSRSFNQLRSRYKQFYKDQDIKHTSKID